MHYRLVAAAAALTLCATPVLAHDHDHGDHLPMSEPQAGASYPGGPYAPPPSSYPGGPDYGPHYGGFDPAAREAWLADCRHRLSSRDSGLGGAVIGGVVGGVAGNRIAGRHNRTVGTVAGAAVGAVAGAAIDKAEDAGRNRDECEAYLDDYYASYSSGGYPGGPYAGYYYQPAYGYAPQGCCMQPMMARPMMMVPVMQPQPHCTETVEYVYEDVPVRPARRHIPRPTKVVPDKRVKLAPDKRVQTK